MFMRAADLLGLGLGLEHVDEQRRSSRALLRVDRAGERVAKLPSLTLGKG
jgi:hypothetical protein